VKTNFREIKNGEILRINIREWLTSAHLALNKRQRIEFCSEVITCIFSFKFNLSEPAFWPIKRGINFREDSIRTFTKKYEIHETSYPKVKFRCQ